VSAVRRCQIAEVIARRSWTTRAPTSRERRTPLSGVWAEGEIENGDHDMRDRTAGRRRSDHYLDFLSFTAAVPIGAP